MGIEKVSYVVRYVPRIHSANRIIAAVGAATITEVGLGFWMTAVMAFSVHG